MSKTFSKHKLIDIDEYERFKQKEIRDYNPLLNMMAKVNIDLEKILANKKMSESMKVLKIGQLKTLFSKLSQEYSPTPFHAPATKEKSSMSTMTEPENVEMSTMEDTPLDSTLDLKDSKKESVEE